MADERTSNGWLRLMTDADLESVLKMRNHSEIRRYMFTQQEISIEEHALWFERASQNPGTTLLIFELGEKCSGFVQFKETVHPGVAEWGFYTAPDAPRGTGRKLGLAALHRAFEKDKLHKICGQSLDWNQPSIQLHKLLGFSQEGVLRGQHFDGETYHDLICFGLLRREWANRALLTGRHE